MRMQKSNNTAQAKKVAKVKGYVVFRGYVNIF